MDGYQAVFAGADHHFGTHRAAAACVFEKAVNIEYVDYLSMMDIDRSIATNSIINSLQ